jgi:hypothetical protein
MGGRVGGWGGGEASRRLKRAPQQEVCNAQLLKTFRLAASSGESLTVHLGCCSLFSRVVAIRTCR